MTTKSKTPSNSASTRFFLKIKHLSGCQTQDSARPFFWAPKSSESPDLRGAPGLWKASSIRGVKALLLALMGWMWSPPHDRWGSEIQKVESWNLRIQQFWQKSFIIFSTWITLLWHVFELGCHVIFKIRYLHWYFILPQGPFLHFSMALLRGEVGISRSGLKPDYFWGIFESSRDLIPGIVKYHAAWGGGMEETFLLGSFSWSLGNGCGVSNGHAKVYQISAGPLHTARCWVAVVEYWNGVDVPRSKQEDFGSWIYKLRWGFRTVCFKCHTYTIPKQHVYLSGSAFCYSDLFWVSASDS